MLGGQTRNIHAAQQEARLLRIGQDCALRGLDQICHRIVGLAIADSDQHGVGEEVEILHDIVPETGRGAGRQIPHHANRVEAGAGEDDVVPG